MPPFRQEDRNKEHTCYVGGLDDKVSDDLLHELMVQAAPVVHVYIPRDRVMSTHGGFGFVEFLTKTDAVYAAEVMNGVRLHGKQLRVNLASIDPKTAQAQAQQAQSIGLPGLPPLQQTPAGLALPTGAAGAAAAGAVWKPDESVITGGIGAEIFIGNLDDSADERLLYDTFTAFGALAGMPRIERPIDASRASKGFVSFASFAAADAAVGAMDGQYLAGRPVSVAYAFKDAKTAGGRRERHGDEAERLLAQRAIENGLRIAPFVMPAMNAGAVVAPAMPAQQPFTNYPSNGQQQRQAPLPAGFATAANAAAVRGAPPPPPPGAPPRRH